MPPPRVVSLLPSATEILCEIGAADLLVGRSHECDWPPQVADRPVLTAARTHGDDPAEIDRQVRESLSQGQSLYTLDAEALAALRPEVILTQDLCEVCSIDLATVERIAASMSPRPRVVNLNPASLEAVFDDLLMVGEAVGRGGAAAEALVRLREAYWTAVDFVNPYEPGPEVAFLEWVEPLFCGGHWTPQLIESAGGRHSLNPPKAKSRRIPPEELLAAAPRRLIVCPCGLPLPAIEPQVASLQATPWWPLLEAGLDGPNAAVMIDGNAMFNRPGPRLVEAFRFLVGWLQDRPELVPPAFPWRPLPRSA
jgi:iron complex transport system substrate-binding protein